MVPCALAFASGIAFSLSHGTPAGPLLLAFAVSLLLLALFSRGRGPSRAAACALCAAFALAGLARGGVEVRRVEVRESAAAAIPEGRATLRGIIESFPEASTDDVEFVLAASTIEMDGGAVRAKPPVRVRVRATLPADAARYGARVAMPVELRHPLGVRNPGGYDEALRARQGGVDLIAHAPGFRIEAVPGLPGRDPLRTALAELRANLLRGADALFEGRARGTFGALVLGERRRILPEDSASLRNAGLLHILAISGMHVVIVAGFATTALSLVAMPPAARQSALAAFLLVYGFLAGFGPPVARATLAAEIVIAGRLLDRRAPAIRHLASTSIILLAWHPFDLLDAGFQLSYAATAGLIVAASWVRGPQGRFMRWIGGPLLISTAAQEFVLPILARQFGCVPVAAPLANLAALPVAGAIVPAGLLLVAAQMSAPLLAPLFAGSFWVLERGLFAVAWLTERTAGRPMPTPVAPFALGVVHAVALVILFRSKGRARVAPAVAAVVTTALFLAGLPRAERDLLVRATFLDVSQGDACVLEIPHWGAILVDAGDADGSYDAGASRVVPFLRRSGIRGLRAAVVTHPHADHYGGLPAVLQMVAAESLYVSAAKGPLEAGYEALLRMADSLGVGRRALAAPETLRLGGSVRVRVVHPPRDHPANDPNDMSVVLVVEAGGASLALTGDAEIAAESLMVSAGLVGAVQVLKVGHHGSNTSSGEHFLQRLHPALSVVSVGLRNRHGLPSASIMERLERHSGTVHRTDASGAAIVEVRRSGVRWRSVGERGWRPIRVLLPAIIQE